MNDDLSERIQNFAAREQLAFNFYDQAQCKYDQQL